ncbi:baseplate assembly protein V [Rhizobium sp. CF080]|uniref:phage baseplate assembly protein V n=1 Tax=Rhizobium sp. (strain CF080) TaxID=1144310 RepID=UPI000271892D|nr:phage baseplate assembly protein V [Rhizobium sp. CF080]EUB97303.1 baseplate assembly protein V [Rhizobium sp. CF080]
MSYEVVFRRLLDRIELLERTLQRVQTRQNSMFREGVVTSVDAENYTAIVDAHGIESKPVPWLQQAGEINEWTPPSKGQRVVLVSPGGDMGKAFILPGGFTDEVKQPHDKGAEKRVKIGGCVLTQSASGLILEVDGTKFEFTAGGFKQTNGDQIHHGGKQEHDGQNVGKTHVHGGIVRGVADTDPPH